MNFLSGSKSSESPTVRSYKPVHSPFSVVVVLGTDEPQQWNFHQWVILGQFGFSECLHSALVEDEYPKILFLEVDTYCIVQIT